MSRRRKPAEIGPWSPGFRTSRYWFDTGLEAARVVSSYSTGEPPWLWCVWLPGAESECSSSGRAESKEEAQEAADQALRDKGHALA